MAEKKNTIDTSLISELARLLTDTDLTEIEVEQNDLRIRVSRNVSVQQQVNYSAPTMAPAQLASASPAVAGASVTASTPSAGTLTSPMVGTAYLSPAPGADPFIKLGDTVAEGQTVLIVEAMKTMNQIAATRSGRITAILVQDGKPVEYGEPLMVIE